MRSKQMELPFITGLVMIASVKISLSCYSLIQLSLFKKRSWHPSGKPEKLCLSMSSHVALCRYLFKSSNRSHPSLHPIFLTLLITCLLSSALLGSGHGRRERNSRAQP